MNHCGTSQPHSVIVWAHNSVSWFKEGPISFPDNIPSPLLPTPEFFRPFLQPRKTKQKKHINCQIHELNQFIELIRDKRGEQYFPTYSCQNLHPPSCQTKCTLNVCHILELISDYLGIRFGNTCSSKLQIWPASTFMSEVNKSCFWNTWGHAKNLGNFWQSPVN